MRAMFLCVIILCLVLWAYVSIHYGQKIGHEISTYLKRLFGSEKEEEQV